MYKNEIANANLFSLRDVILNSVKNEKTVTRIIAGGTNCGFKGNKSASINKANE